MILLHLRETENEKYLVVHHVDLVGSFFPSPFLWKGEWESPSVPAALGLVEKNRCVLVQLCSTCSCWDSKLLGDSSMPCQGWEAGVSLLGLVLTLHLSRLQSELRISSCVITVVHFNHLGLSFMVSAKSGSFFPLFFLLTSLASEISAVCECV